MADRLDIVIFGATGFTGKHVVAEVHKQSKEKKNLKWGVAGRSEEKLKKVIEGVEDKTGDDLKDVAIIIADVSDEESLKKMAERAKLIINCCGPFRLFGEPVVKACVETGTHHVDVSGEPQYMERMQLEYNKTAEEKGAYIVSACGFDSIPTEMGIVHIQDKFDGVVNSVETYLHGSKKDPSKEGGAGLHYGTWESAVYGLAYAKELKPLRSKLYPERLPVFKPVLQSKSVVHRSKTMNGKYCVPFLGSDRSVVNRSQRFLFENNKIRPVQIRTYLAVDSLFYVLMLAIFGAIFAVLSKFSLGRYLLLKYHRFFSGGLVTHEGPSEEALANTLFSITFRAEGWTADKKLAEPTDQYEIPPNKLLVAKVHGKDPGYGATSAMLVQSALTILEEKDKLPKNGGVIPPGAAFAKTSLIDRLDKNGVHFEILLSKEK